VRLATAAVVIGCAERVCPKAMPRATRRRGEPMQSAGVIGGTQVGKLTGIKQIKHGALSHNLSKPYLKSYAVLPSTSAQGRGHLF